MRSIEVERILQVEPTLTKFCPICKQLMHRNKDRLESVRYFWEKKKYCSNKCRYKASKGRPITNHTIRYEINNERYCKGCNKVFAYNEWNEFKNKSNCNICGRKLRIHGIQSSSRRLRERLGLIRRIE